MSGELVLVLSVALTGVVASTLCVLVHELGHALGAWMMEIPIKEVRVGADSGRRVRLTFNGLRIELSPFAQEGAVVPDVDVVDARRYLVVVLAGPAGSLLLAAFMAKFAIDLETHRPSRDLAFLASPGDFAVGMVALTCSMTACISAFVGIGSLLPAQVGASSSDGFLAWMAWRAIRDRPPPELRNPRHPNEIRWPFLAALALTICTLFAVDERRAAVIMALFAAIVALNSGRRHPAAQEGHDAA